MDLRVFVLFVGTSVIAMSCTHPLLAQVERSGRRLAVDLNEGNGVSYDKAVDAVRSIGAESASISLNWDQIEPKPGEFTDPGNFLYLIDTYFPAKELSVDLFLRAVDTDGRHVPSDLVDVAFDDKVMIERFRKLLDFVFSRIPNAKLNFVSIGNELTLAFPPDNKFWSEYESFFQQAKDHVKRLRPKTTVGAVGTMYEVFGSHKVVMERLNRHSDVILVSYYPLNGDFTVKPATVIAKDIDALTKVYPKRPIYFSETGYPSSKLLRSSEEKQSQYVDAIFAAWDDHATQLKYISFAWLHDQSKQQLDEFERYYGTSHPNFRAYLGTLGLRHRNGSPKPAFDALRRQARIRGWK